MAKVIELCSSKGLKILTPITSEYVWLYLDNNETLFGNAVIANDPVKGTLYSNMADNLIKREHRLQTRGY